MADVPERVPDRFYADGYDTSRWRRGQRAAVTDVRVEPTPDGVRVVADSRVAAPDVANAWVDQTTTYTVTAPAPSGSATG